MTKTAMGEPGLSLASAPPEHELIACPDCDLLLDSGSALPEGSSVRCPRCDTELFRVRDGNLERLVALTIGALLLFLLSNLFPIVGLNIQGHQVETTLLGAAHRLWESDMFVLAGVVAATTVFVPALEIAAVLWIVFPLWRGRCPRAFALVFRLMHATQPWGMVEVFMLGVLVSLVKLSHLADVLPGFGIWAYGALMLMITAVSANFDSRAIWQAWERLQA